MVVALTPCAAFAQGFHSVFTPDGLAVWAAGDSSAIYLSTDAGVSYQRQTTGTISLYGIASFGFSTLAVGAGGRVYRSTNSGGVWTTQDLAGSPDLRGIAYPAFGIAYAVGAAGVIRKSTDGGATWNSQTSGVATTLRALRFTDVQTGWAVGDAGTVLHTLNGGDTWTPVVLPTSNDLLAIDQAGSEVWVGGAAGACLKSTDGGANWSHVNLKLDSRSDVRALRVVSSTDVYVAGGGGFVRRTLNGGTTWTFQRHNMLARATGLSGSGTRMYLCSDRHRVVYRTADAGNVWGMPPISTFSRTFVQKLDVSFGTTIRGNTIALNPRNPRSLFAVLGAQTYKSLDEGETWSPIGTAIPGASRANAFIVSPKDSNLWVAAVAGLEGQIVRSTNAGVSWTAPLTMNYGEYGVPLEMHPERPDTLYFGPADDPLWRSTNFGSTWAVWTTDSAFRSPCDLIVVPDSAEIVLVGDGTTNSTNPPAQVYKSTNAGLTFQLMYSGPGGQDASEMPGMACSRLNKGVAYGTHWSGGGTVRSTNFGSTWTQVQPSPQAWGIDVAKDDPNLVMFGQYSGQTFFMSTDGGGTWQGSTTTSGSNYGLYARDRELILTTQSAVGPAGPGIWKLRPTYNYSPVSAQFILLNSPNGGDSWTAGTTRSIVWSHQNIAIARIEFRAGPEDPWQHVADVPGYHGGYDWLVPHVATYDAEIRISDAWDGVPADASDVPFTILAPGFTALPNPLDLGVILTGTTASDTVHFENSGTAALSITSISSNHPEFVTSRTSLTIAAGAADTITVLYHPLAAGADTATLSITATNLPGPNQVIVRGRANDNTGVGGIPAAFALHQNAPNPFGGRTLIRYALPVATDVTLEVFDLRGRRVATLVRGRQEAGEHSATFGGTRDGGAGVYFYRLKAGSFAATRKMLYVK